MKRPLRTQETLNVQPGRAGKGGQAPPVAMDLRIDEIGVRGDGAANAEGGPYYVAFSLPGERVHARVQGERGELLEVLEPSAARIAPACGHFSRCGGCQLQHWAVAPYLDWKRQTVVRALRRRGVEAEVEAVGPAWGAGRRRAAFHADAAGRFGFMARGSNGLIDVSECPALTPRLAAALPRLRTLARRFAPMRGEITLACLDAEAGLDVDIKGAGSPAHFTQARLEEAAAAADEADLARLSFNGDSLVTRRAPALTMGVARVTPPPGAFVQPTQMGEDLLAARTMEALGGAVRIADLFAGVGTFALRLAAQAEVHAVDGEAPMLAALKRAADGAAGALKRVTVERRDLFRAPLAALELKRFDAVAFDPPRSGARGQAQQIAASRVSKVAAVSCDAAAFARDARILIDSGFRLRRVSPLDQFRWSPHIEIVGAFER